MWNGYIDGAIRSGQRAAAEVVAARGKGSAPVAAPAVTGPVVSGPADPPGGALAATGASTAVEVAGAAALTAAAGLAHRRRSARD